MTAEVEAISERQRSVAIERRTVERSDRHKVAGTSGSKDENATRYGSLSRPFTSASPSISLGRTWFHIFWAYSSYLSARYLTAGVLSTHLRGQVRSLLLGFALALGDDGEAPGGFIDECRVESRQLQNANDLFNRGVSQGMSEKGQSFHNLPVSQP